jgi:hypothetical protein
MEAVGGVSDANPARGNVRLNEKSGESKYDWRNLMGAGTELKLKWTELRIPQFIARVWRKCIHRATAKGPDRSCDRIEFPMQLQFWIVFIKSKWDEGGACCTTLFSHPVATVQRIGTMETFNVLLQLQLQKVAI